MAEYIVQDTTLRGLADEIRRETGKSDPLLGASMTDELRTFSDSLAEEIALQNAALDDLEAELNSLEEGIRPEGTLSITENGTYDVMDKASVEVNTPVPEGTLVITENGTHDVSYKANVEVNVAGSGGSDSNKLALVAGTQSADNLYDITAADLDGVTEIKKYTFYQGKGLRSIALPTTCTSIGNSAFQDCSALTSVSMPNVTSLGYYAFQYCASLPSVDMPSVTSIGNSAFQGCKSLTSVPMPNVTSINYSAFESCKSLTSVDMPNVTSISRQAFYYCSALTAASMPNATSIGEYAFGYCSELPSVDMPKVTSIGEGAFYKCTALTSLTISSTCTSIGKYALQCGSSTNKCTFTFEGTTPPSIQSNTFNASNINKIIVPVGCGETYKTATNWSNFADYIEEAAE